MRRARLADETRNGLGPAMTAQNAPRVFHEMQLFLLNLMLSLIILCLTGCGGTAPSVSGFASPEPASADIVVSVNPSSIALAAGSTATFTAFITPSLPAGSFLTWSVSPANGGTITRSGAFTSSGIGGIYTVFATWIPANPATGTAISGSATVKVLSIPQPGAELNPDRVQASGAIQTAGTIQHAAIVGQSVSSVISIDPSGNVQVRSGFAVPVVCTGSDVGCR